MDKPKTTSCRDKLSFETKAQAIGAAATARFRYGRSQGSQLNPYKCSKCHLWHLATDYFDV